MATRRATHIGDETLLTMAGRLVGVPGGDGQRRMPRSWPGRSGEGSDAGVLRLVSSVGYLAGPAVVGEGLADPPANPRVRVIVAGLRARITAGTRGAGVLSVMAWITSPRTRGSGSPASSSNLVHTRSSSARTWQVHRFLHASWRARLSWLRDSSSSPSIASLAVRPSPAWQADPCLLSDLAPPSHRPDDTARPSRSRSRAPAASGRPGRGSHSPMRRDPAVSFTARSDVPHVIS